MTSPWYFAAIIASLLLAAFFSAAEMAYASVNRIRLENASEAGSRRAAVAMKICDRYDEALSAILIGNNLVNIGASSLASVIAIQIAGESWTWLSTVILTILIIVFCETLPKIAAKKNANRLALSFSYAVRAFTILLKPVIFLVVGLVRLLLTPFKGEKQENEQEEAAAELQSLIETVEDEGVIDGERSELLQAALDFSEISAQEVMTARVDMDAIDIEDDWEDILEAIESATHSRLPVYEDSIDNIIGILYLNRFYRAMLDGGKVDIRSLLMEPCFVYKTVKLPKVLAELRHSQMHLAIVTDEYGGCLGLVTMEDVLEQIVGDIWDETDEVETEVLKRQDGSFELGGNLPIGEFAELLGTTEEALDTDSATAGGWTLEKFGDFPEQGQSIQTDGLKVTVLAMDGLRVERLLVEPLPEERDS
jgi:putative hemolysin